MDVRYRRWDGTGDPFADRPDLHEVLERLGDDLLGGVGGRAALQRLRREGLGTTSGLDDLARRARRRRDRIARATDLEGPLREVRGELEAILAAERDALADRDDEQAWLAELALDALPADPAGRIRGLEDHDFASGEAEERFERLLERLRQEILDAHLGRLTAALESVTPEDVGALTTMLGDLNAMLDARERGEEPDFDGFMDRHGDRFPEQPETLDELLDVLARRLGATSRMLASLPPPQRRQLLDLARTVFDDLDLQLELSRLEDHLRDLAPRLAWDAPVGEPGQPGSESLPGVVDALEQISELDALIEALEGGYAGARMEDIDPDTVRRHLDDEAVEDLAALRRIERELERAGVLRREEGELVLTPRGARLLGERALTRILERIPPEPRPRRSGPAGERTGQTRPWRFGDTEPIAPGRTVHNAVLRRAGRTGPGVPVRLAPEDLAVRETEVRPRTATALLLDLSFSMPLQGHLVPAKRMALALHALIEGRHRRDSLHLIGFKDYARRLRPVELAAAGFERVQGTNMHHALLLARRALLEDPRPIKQVIMVTDGEPTAHLDGGESVFHWPPVRETLERTLREAARLARAEITVNVFLLEDAPGLVAFAGRLAEVTGGTVLEMSAEEIGDHVLRGY